ncbi:hypothetical protein BDA96_03G404800 [Sorghum bicolor]|uniref:Uncharacterized protein n=1 Tax=Sorghum bicolor TaxID=4558 RepID=A0A921RJT8_SORBI|nr:hypothetical protein BDA96_03G404800 [Sorghum bicolor]
MAAMKPIGMQKVVGDWCRTAQHFGFHSPIFNLFLQGDVWAVPVTLQKGFACLFPLQENVAPKKIITVFYWYSVEFCCSRYFHSRFCSTRTCKFFTYVVVVHFIIVPKLTDCPFVVVFVYLCMWLAQIR